MRAAMSPRLRWFWRIYIPFVLLVPLTFLAIQAGPVVEQRFFPIRGPQSISAVTRADGRLCWDWTFVKRRGTSSDNLDSFILIDGEPGGVVAPFDAATGHYWGLARFAVAPRPEPYTIRYCVPLPPYVTAADAVRIRQTTFYPGWLGLWRLAVPFPDVVSEGRPGL